MSGSQLVDDLLGPALEHGPERAQLINRITQGLLRSGGESGYRRISDQADAILAALRTPEQRASLVLGAWAVAPAEDWGTWAERLPPTVGNTATAAAAAVLKHMLDHFNELEPAAQETAVSLLARLRNPLAHLSAEDVDDVVAPSAESALAERAWAADGAARTSQAHLHCFLREVETLSPDSKTLMALRSADLSRPFEEDSGDAHERLRGAREMSARASREALDIVLAALPTADPQYDPQTYAESLWTELAIRLRLATEHDQIEDPAPFVERLRTALSLGPDFREAARGAASEWLQLIPRAGDVNAIIRAIGPRPRGDTEDAAQSWARLAGSPAVTTLMRRLVDKSFEPEYWMAALRGGDYTESKVLARVEQTMLDEARRLSNPERLRIAGAVEGLHPRTRDGRNRMADLAIELLRPKRPRNDLAVALRLCRGLSPEHDRRTKLRKALCAYADRYGVKFTPEQHAAILTSGVDLPNKYLSKKALKTITETVEEVQARFEEAGRAVGGFLRRLTS